MCLSEGSLHANYAVTLSSGDKSEVKKLTSD